jgi:Universal stress protein family
MKNLILCVLDTSDELRASVRYAARLAQLQQCRVALLHVLEPLGVDHWQSLADHIEEEQQSGAQQLIQHWSGVIYALTGQTSQHYILSGNRRDAVLQLLKDEPAIVHLVLGAAAHSDDPGPLVSALVGRHGGRMPVPVTVIPGGLSNEAIDCLLRADYYNDMAMHI